MHTVTHSRIGAHLLIHVWVYAVYTGTCTLEFLVRRRLGMSKGNGGLFENIYYGLKETNQDK